MASEDYYNDTKRFDGQNPISSYSPAPEQQQTPMPPASGYNAYQPQYYAGPQYPPQTQPQSQPEPYYQNQYQPTGYGEQYQQPPPPPYYQQPYTEQPPYASPQPAYAPAATATPDGPVNPADPNDRGVLGAIAGGAAGGYTGHQVHHGVLGTLGGALAGSLAEDAIKKKTSEKKEKKEKKSRFGFHRRGSSSSSSSSDSEKEDKKPKPAPAPQQRSGNFSASSNSISLRGNYELVAACRSRSGHQHESRLPLSSVLTNEFGHFKWKRNGNFGASARNARLTEGGRVLEAELADGRGGWRRDWIRLDERISNDDGNLVFLD
ncbi:CVNH domain-containing protein [Aspergillus pseudodeflectus]|uniref:CVNH domain-containing protein n=1 Tax=Aspergillus pseudodeflectus TaxID=176178 RepID=A0ABR4KC87_9EURO